MSFEGLLPQADATRFWFMEGTECESLQTVVDNLHEELKTQLRVPNADREMLFLDWADALSTLDELVEKAISAFRAVGQPFVFKECLPPIMADIKRKQLTAMGNAQGTY